MALSEALIGERTNLCINVDAPQKVPNLDAKQRVEDLQFMCEYLES